MRKLMLTSLVLFVFTNCDKPKTDKEKLIGTWKREMSVTRIDTVVFTDNQFFANKKIYNYYLKDNRLYYHINNDTFLEIFTFISDTKFKTDFFISVGEYYLYTKL